MPNIAYFLYKYPIFKIVRLWEQGHFVDILEIKHQIHCKVIFEKYGVLSISRHEMDIKSLAISCGLSAALDKEPVPAQDRY